MSKDYNNKTFICNNRECATKLSVSNDEFFDSRNTLKKHKWICLNDLHFCPDCKEEAIVDAINNIYRTLERHNF